MQSAYILVLHHAGGFLKKEEGRKKRNMRKPQFRDPDSNKRSLSPEPSAPAKGSPSIYASHGHKMAQAKSHSLTIWITT